MKADLIVVGAGVLGTFHAYHALRQGRSVVLLEKDAMPAGATVRNFGQIGPSCLGPGRWQNLGIESMKLYKGIQSEYDISVRRGGSVYLASDGAECTLVRDLHDYNKAIGYPLCVPFGDGMSRAVSRPPVRLRAWRSLFPRGKSP